jgi:RES domain
VTRRAAPALKLAKIKWQGAVRIIRSIYPPIDLFEDIADPADWPLLISAEQKTNPRIMETIGNLDLVPEERRVAGSGATYLMAPFTHVSPDRQSRFCDGSYGVLYAGNSFEVALFETVHHHARFMARTREPAGWTSQYREIVMKVDAQLHDLRGGAPNHAALLAPDDYSASQIFAAILRNGGASGLVYPSVRYAKGECVGLFYPDLACDAIQGRHLDYHWNGQRVDLYRDAGKGEVFRIIESDPAAE